MYVSDEGSRAVMHSVSVRGAGHSVSGVGKCGVNADAGGAAELTECDVIGCKWSSGVNWFGKGTRVEARRCRILNNGHHVVPRVDSWHAVCDRAGGGSAPMRRGVFAWLSRAAFGCGSTRAGCWRSTVRSGSWRTRSWRGTRSATFTSMTPPARWSWSATRRCSRGRTARCSRYSIGGGPRDARGGQGEA